jgi:uncharacterized protein YuzE
MVGILMRITYDDAADAAYIFLGDSIAPGAVARTRPTMLEFDRSFIALDFDSNGKVLGIEILGASRIVDDGILRSAERPGLRRPQR